MQKLCCVRTRQHPLPVWSQKFVISSLTHFSTNSRPFLVGIVSNLLHDLITGRSVTAVLHFFNLTPGNWYSKRQATVENATYGSEFVAAKTATEQIIDIRQTLRYLGVPIKSKAYMFGDNKSVVTSSTVPHSLLSERHNILSYHRVREAIAAKILVFHWCDSSQNKSDILSKHWEFSKVFHIIRDLFDFQGKISLIQ